MSARWVGVGARELSRVGVVAACAAIIVVAVVVPWHGVERAPVAVRVLPEPAASVVVCSGPLLAAGREATQADALTQVADQRVVVGDSDVAAIPGATRLHAEDVPAGSGPQTYIAAPADRARTDVAASGSARVAADDLSGFAASACTPPQLDSWLVGGSAETGAADLVVLSNPSAVPAQVDLTVYGGGGEQTPATGQDIVVRPGAQRVIPLASLGIGEPVPVVRVTASDAAVRASLQTSIIRTLVPGGVDQVTATSAPAATQVIPAVAVTRDSGEAGAVDATTVLRVLAPSAAASASVTITKVGSSASGALTRSISLTEGVPLELDLDALTVGTYTVRVEASAPVVAAAWSATGFGAGADFAWFPAADVFTVPSLVAIATGPRPTLTFSNDTDEPVAVRATADVGEGAVVEITVPARGAATMPARAGQVYRLTSDGAVRAAVDYRGTGALAGYPVVPADAAAPAITIYPQ